MKKNLKEEIAIMRSLMSAKHGIIKPFLSNLLKEQNEKKFTDWSEGGTKTWENADIKKLIQFIREQDITFAFSRSPIYNAMLDWFEDHPDTKTRESLKSWAGSKAFSSGGESNEKDYVSFANNILSMTNPNTTEGRRKKLENFVNITKDSKLKVSAQNIIKQLDRINKEYKEFKRKRVFPSTEFSKEVYDELVNLFKGIKMDGTLNIVDDETIDLNTILSNLTSFDIISSAKDSGNVNIESDENIKTQIISQLYVRAAEKLNDKDFLDGFFRGVKPTLEGMILKAKVIEITESNVNIVAQYKDAKVKEKSLGRQLAVKTFTYPQEGLDQNKRNELAMNMFPDDGDQLGPEAENGLKSMVGEALQVYNSAIAEDEGAELKTINIRVYSSTSKVRTKYKSDKYSEQNNKQLATARANIIEKRIKELIGDTDLSSAENVVTILKVVDANRGPGWNDQISVDLAGQPMDFATAYANAPLYVAAHNKYPKLTARQFYGGRDNNAAAYVTKLIGKSVSVEDLEIEYENVYAKWRYCMGGIDLNMFVNKSIIEEDPEQDFVVAVAGGLSAEISWRGDGGGGGGGRKKRRKNKNKFWRKVYLRLTGQRGGKGKTFKRSIGCPVW